jgi:hypothetical protein
MSIDTPLVVQARHGRPDGHPLDVQVGYGVAGCRRERVCESDEGVEVVYVKESVSIQEGFGFEVDFSTGA